jgi:nucleoside-diphosphate-sugar epimerase
MPAALIRNARLRREGTRNLVAAALAAGARRLIAQSIAWAYAPGPEPHREEDPLDLAAAGGRGASVAAIAELERLTLASPPLAGVVLRYGNLWGPGTGRDRPEGAAPVHVDAAAHAALLALDRGAPGAYNVAGANAALGWDPAFRSPA